MATALTSELTRFTDKCNNVLAGGIVKTFEPNTLTPKTSYQDPECTIPNFPEVNLDETGRARIYLKGDYRVQVYSRDGVLIEDNLLVEQSLAQRDFVELSQSLQAEQQEKLNQFQGDVETQINVIGTGNRAYKTYAEMDAEKASIPANSKVTVTGDPDTTKRGDWQWDGAVFTKSPYDPLTQSKNYTDNKVEFWQVTEIAVREFGPFSKFAAGFVGSNNLMPLGITKEGAVVAQKIQSSSVEVENFNANQSSVSSQIISGVGIQKLDPFSGYVFGIGNGAKYPLALRTDGTIEIDKLKVNEIAVTSDDSSNDKYEKMSQEWWVYPTHIFVEKPYPHVISGSYGEDGSIYVNEYVVGKGVTKKIKVGQTPIVDDHNAPSVWVKKERRSIVMWTQHSQTQYIQAKTSTQDGDISTLAFATEQQINIGDVVSYTQLHHIESESNTENDVFLIFSRTLAGNNWDITKISVNQSTGVITKLSQVRILNADNQYYMTSTLAGEVLRIASAFNPAQPTNQIHYWEINITTGDMKTHTGSTVGNILTGTNLPAKIENITPLLAHKANYRRRLFYVRSLPMSPAIAYAEWLIADAPNSGVYKVASLENGSWIIRDYESVGKAFDSTYFAGAAFPEPCVKDELIVCKYDNVNSQGVLERVIRHGDQFQVTETKRSMNFLIRPISPKDGGGMCSFVELYSYGKTTSFSFESDVNLTFLK